MFPDEVLLRRDAQVRALQTRASLQIPMDREVDVFSVIRALRLWLLFEPLDGLFGMYQRQPDAAGIVLSVKVHPALQRYTAAHELGHHVLGHELGMDPEKHVNTWSGLPRDELAAQMFAAEFLMPLPAVNAAAIAMGIKQRGLDDIHTYQLSLRLRTSYSAMITRLQTLQWIDSTEARQLRAVTPKSIKQRLLGRPPADAASDVWVVTESQEQAAISPLVGDEVIFALTENPSTGYRWEPDLPDSVRMERDDFFEVGPNQEQVVGSAGRRQLQMSVRGESSSQAKFRLRRGWESGQPAATLELSLNTTARPVRGVDAVQQPALLLV